MEADAVDADDGLKEKTPSILYSILLSSLDVFNQHQMYIHPYNLPQGVLALS